MAFDHARYYREVVLPKRRAAGVRERRSGGAEDRYVRLRLPAELHARLTAAAKANRRSLNAELMARLEAAG